MSFHSKPRPRRSDAEHEFIATREAFAPSRYAPGKSSMYGCARKQVTSEEESDPAISRRKFKSEYITTPSALSRTNSMVTERARATSHDEYSYASLTSSRRRRRSRSPTRSDTSDAVSRHMSKRYKSSKHAHGSGSNYASGRYASSSHRKARRAPSIEDHINSLTKREYSLMSAMASPVDSTKSSTTTSDKARARRPRYPSWPESDISTEKSSEVSVDFVDYKAKQKQKALWANPVNYHSTPVNPYGISTNPYATHEDSDDPNQDEAWTLQEMMTAFGLNHPINAIEYKDEASQAEQMASNEERDGEVNIEYVTSFTQTGGQYGQVEDTYHSETPMNRKNSSGDDEIMFITLWALLVLMVCCLRALKDANEASSLTENGVRFKLQVYDARDGE